MGDPVDLAQSDLRVGELTELVGEPQNLVSYHLASYATPGWCRSRRSSFDGRDTYYRVDLDRCGALLCDTAAALHPALRFVPSGATPPRRSGRPPRVLFLCTGNSARSQMAAALLEHRCGRRDPGPQRGQPSQAVASQRGAGDGRAGHRHLRQPTKHLRRYARSHFDYVVTLCDKVREVCPEFPAEPATIHWSMPDPAPPASTDDETYPAFQQAADELETRIPLLVAQLFASRGGPAHAR